MEFDSDHQFWNLGLWKHTENNSADGSRKKINHKKYQYGDVLT